LDRVVVQLLGFVDGAGPATAGQGRRAVSPAAFTLVWADGDWRIALDPAPDPAQPLPAPGSVQAYQEGWRDLALA
jgi:hypothetical protein